MYAVIETGGKQYRVEVGTELEVESLDIELGKTLSIDRVLLVADGDEASIGRPVVDGAAVSAEVIRQTRGDKVINFKYGPKTRRRVKKGHRQDLTILRISDIVFGGKSAAKSAAKAEQDKKTERQRLEEAARKQAEQDAALAAKLAADKAKAGKDDKSGAKTSRRAADKGNAEASKPAAKASGRTAKADTTGAADKPKARAKTADDGKPAKKTQK
jgi:large subunit ribosomal protein L21